MATKGRVGDIKTVTQLSTFATNTGDNQILGRLQRGFSAAAPYYRAILDKKMNVVTNVNEVIQKYKVSLDTISKITPEQWNIITVTGMSRESKSGGVPPLTQAVKKLLNLPDLTKDSQFGHTDVQASAVAVSNLYKALSLWIQGTESQVLAQRNSPSNKGVKGSAKMRLSFRLPQGTTYMFEEAPVKGTLSQAKIIKSQVGILVIAYHKLQGYTKSITSYGSGSGTGAFGRGKLQNMYDNLAEDINETLNDPTFDIEILVDRNINILNEATVKGEYMSKEANQLLGKIEGGLAVSAQNIGLKNKNLQQKVEGMMSKVDWSKVTFSKSLEEEIHKQVLDLATTGKIKKVRTRKNLKGKKRISMKSATSGTRKTNTKNKRKSVTSKNKAVLQAIAQGAGMKSTPNKRNNEGALKDIVNLKAQINKRLPAETRRNMGRPALINRTSRFSNSVRLDDLRATAAGLSGTYSYLLSPYETFENTGEKQWRIGYNPKTLIAKSIRNLALAYTDKKLASLRRR
tara:strand:- start:171 stop:1715 length:1545 start_codon:yes stop_codon:yes gene_type:complete